MLKAFKKELPRLLLAFIPYSIGLTSIIVSGQVLQKYYPFPVTPHDLILDNLPEYHIFVKVGEISSVLVVILLFVSAYQLKLKNLPEYFTRSGVMITLRAITIVLTPLASIQNAANNGSLPFFSQLYYGMFFSGHTAGAFLIYFLDKGDNKKIKYAKLVLASTVGISLILSHSHYSIDVVAAIPIAFAVSKMWIPASLKEKTKTPK